MGRDPALARPGWPQAELGTLRARVQVLESQNTHPTGFQRIRAELHPMDLSPPRHRDNG